MASKRLSAEWAKAFARQASADLDAFEKYGKYPGLRAAECHKMLFLQMACEKLCKAHLIAAGTDPSKVQASHRYIAGPLPVIIKQEISLRKITGLKGFRGLVHAVQRLAREIELLNPSVDDDGKRPANCEYPWEAGEKVLSPLDHTFTPSELLVIPTGRTFLKVLRLAIQRNL